MAELTPNSKRNEGPFGRVHAAAQRLPALIFLSPDFSTPNMHPQNYLQYYPHAEIIKLPFGAEEARATILNRIAAGIAKGEKPHTILINADGHPNGMAIGGDRALENQRPDKTKELDIINVEGLLGDIAALRKGAKPIASNIILSSCDVLADASPAYLDRMAALPKALGANIIASSNAIYTTATVGKGWRGNNPTPAVGRFYQITKEGHFVPYFDFRDEKYLALGDDLTMRLGMNSGLVEKRAALDANCSSDPTAACARLKKDYQEFSHYAAIRDRISHKDISSMKPSETLEMVKVLEAMSLKVPSAERLQILKDIGKLQPFGSKEYTDTLNKSANLILSGALRGNAEGIYNSMYMLAKEDTLGAYDHFVDPQFAAVVAEKLAALQGMPTDDQMKAWRVMQNPKWKPSALKAPETDLTPAAKDALRLFEHGLANTLNDKKYPLSDRANAADIVLSSESTNPELRAAAQKAVDCNSGFVCSVMSAIKQVPDGTQSARKAPSSDKASGTQPRSSKLSAPATP